MKRRTLLSMTGAAMLSGAAGCLDRTALDDRAERRTDGSRQDAETDTGADDTAATAESEADPADSTADESDDETEPKTACEEFEWSDLEDGEYPPVALADAPEPYEETGSTAGDPTSDAYHSHILGYDSFVEDLEEYNETRDITILYHHHLEKTLAENPDMDRLTIDATVLGERYHTVSEGSYERDIYSFRPSECEVETLNERFDVTNVPDFMTTKVTLDDVHRDDIPLVAALPFVVQVNYLPPARPHASDVNDTTS